MAKELSRQLNSQPNGYHPRDVLWDFAALYGKDASWGQTPPAFTGGPVVSATPALAKKLAAYSGSSVGG
ncbi:MAG TPA: hypothetical protein VJQ50_00095 [Terriglobales bacterium]|nr:hypothetical protein [Terriglobales bacterium]